MESDTLFYDYKNKCAIVNTICIHKRDEISDREEVCIRLLCG